MTGPTRATKRKRAGAPAAQATPPPASVVPGVGAFVVTPPPAKKQRIRATKSTPDVTRPDLAKTVAGFDPLPELNPTQWEHSGESTYATVMWESEDGELVALGVAESVKATGNQGGHAEDVALRTIRDNMELFDPTQTNELVLTITKSPCTSTSRNGLPVTSKKAKGCTEELIDLVTKGISHNGLTYRFALTLICRGLYAPQPEKGQKQKPLLAASQAAVEAMRDAKILVQSDPRVKSSEHRFEIATSKPEPTPGPSTSSS